MPNIHCHLTRQHWPLRHSSQGSWKTAGSSACGVCHELSDNLLPLPHPDPTSHHEVVITLGATFLPPERNWAEGDKGLVAIKPPTVHSQDPGHPLPTCQGGQAKEKQAAAP